MQDKRYTLPVTHSYETASKHPNSEASAYVDTSSGSIQIAFSVPRKADESFEIKLSTKNLCEMLEEIAANVPGLSAMFAKCTAIAAETDAKVLEGVTELVELTESKIRTARGPFQSWLIKTAKEQGNRK